MAQRVDQTENPHGGCSSLSYESKTKTFFLRRVPPNFARVKRFRDFRRDYVKIAVVSCREIQNEFRFRANSIAASGVGYPHDPRVRTAVWSPAKPNAWARPTIAVARIRR